MNRADQAAEPTMEEILASIRLIISDDSRKAPLSGEAVHGVHPAPPVEEPGQEDQPPAEDVLDLTEELVFPEGQPARVEAAAKTEISAGAPPVEELPAEEDSGQEMMEDAPQAAQPVEMPPAMALQPETPAPRENLPEPRPDLSQRAAPMSSRPVWSRREMPPSAMPAPAGAFRSPQTQAARRPERGWAEDVQMPIPDSGPIPLIPQDEPEEAASEELIEAKQFPDVAVENKVEKKAAHASHLAGEQEVAVAVMAEKMARSAAGAMDEDELATAGAVDFGQIEESRRAGVTETFANAIQRQGGMREKQPLPTLLDEVLRQDFLREQAAESKPARVSAEFQAPSEAIPQPKYGPARNDRPAQQWGRQELPPRSQERPASPPEVRSGLRPQVPEASAPVQPPVQAQFVGTAQPVRPATGVRSFEDAIGDMLRPLLMQWLNENMPRILEGAIREEIAKRGLLPKTEE